MKKLVVLWIFVLAFQFSEGMIADTVELKPKPMYGREARVISYILDRDHYRKISLNDSLSSAILKQYLNDLDNDKIYFLAADIALFDKYKSSIDDLTRREDVSPAYEMYAVFSKRYSERLD